MKTKFAVMMLMGLVAAVVAGNLPDTPVPDAWVTHGTGVYSMEENGGKIYLGGDFTRVGPHTGAGVVLDTDTSQPRAGGARVNNTLRASVSDGNGGWYIGGEFTEINGQERLYLAHIDATGALTAWNPAANGKVLALAISPDGATVYAGGSFTGIGTAERSRIAALDAGSGLPSAWNPNADDDVLVIILSTNGNTVYVGGDFTAIGGQARNRIAALSPASGLATAWAPDADGSVRALKLAPAGGVIYTGGGFDNIGGEVRGRIAAIDTDTGLATAWDPNASGNVGCLAVSSDGGVVYAGGFFLTIAGELRRGLAALDAVTGDATAWNVNATNGWFVALELSGDDGILYAGGGGFAQIGGQPYRYIAALDTDTGAAIEWQPYLNLWANTLALSEDQSSIFAGGAFSSVGGEARNRLAALDAYTGQLLDWAPEVTGGLVKSLAVSPDGSTVYVGGLFTNIGGVARSRIAALDGITGAVKEWNPGASAIVDVLMLSPDASTVYAGGLFLTIGGQPRNRIAAIDTVTDNVLGWDPDANGRVESMVFSPDGTSIYVGGQFTTIAGLGRNRLVELNAATGAATTWDPNPDSNVTSLAVASDGSVVYVGGAFTNIGGASRVRLAAIDAVTGNANAWHPTPGSTVNALKLAPDAARIYAGGSFTNIGGTAKRYLAALDTGDASVLAWNPQAEGTVNALCFSDDQAVLYVGGFMSSLGGENRRGFAMFSPQHTLRYTAGANGAISGTATQTVYHGCDGTQVNAIPDTGYHFTQWSDGSTANPRRDSNVTGNVSVVAAFALTLTPPDKPLNVTASAGDQLGKVSLTWNAAARATIYEVWRDTDPAGTGAAKAHETSGTAWDDSSAVANVNYYYWIKARNSAGASAFSAAAHGFAGVVGPMIMANGMVGDNIRLATGQPLALTARLHRGGYPAVPVDWWVGAYLHRSQAWYYMDSQRQWVPFSGDPLECRPVAMAPLADLPLVPVYSFASLPAGTYNVWFVVDYPMDGVLNLTPGYYFMARVTIVVE